MAAQRFGSGKNWRQRAEDLRLRDGRSVWDELLARYEAHGGEYASGEIHEPSGLAVNQAMFKNNLVDVEEELVDALFNALVYNFRDRSHGNYLISALFYTFKILAQEYEVQREMARS